MGLRSLLGRAVDKMDEFGDRMPCRRARQAHARGARALRVLGAPRRGGPQRHAAAGPRRRRSSSARSSQGPAGEVVHGVGQAPSAAPRSRTRGVGAAAAGRARGARRGARPVPRARSATRSASRASPAISGTQLQEVADHLGACGLAGAARPRLRRLPRARPDQPGPARRRARERRGVGHRARGRRRRCRPPPPPAFLRLDAARRAGASAPPGEPRPLDEDLALDLLARAGVGPERTLGDRPRRRHSSTAAAGRTARPVADRRDRPRRAAARRARRGRGRRRRGRGRAVADADGPPERRRRRRPAVGRARPRGASRPPAPPAAALAVPVPAARPRRSCCAPTSRSSGSPRRTRTPRRSPTTAAST